MGTADEAKLRSGIRIFPHNGIIVFDPFQFCIVNDIDLCALGDERSALLLCLGGQILNVVETDCAVGGGGCAKVL